MTYYIYNHTFEEAFSWFLRYSSNNERTIDINFIQDVDHGEIEHYQLFTGELHNYYVKY